MNATYKFLNTQKNVGLPLPAPSATVQFPLEFKHKRTHQTEIFIKLITRIGNSWAKMKLLGWKPSPVVFCTLS